MFFFCLQLVIIEDLLKHLFVCEFSVVEHLSICLQ